MTETRSPGQLSLCMMQSLVLSACVLFSLVMLKRGCKSSGRIRSGAVGLRAESHVICSHDAAFWLCFTGRLYFVFPVRWRVSLPFVGLFGIVSDCLSTTVVGTGCSGTLEEP